MQWFESRLPPRLLFVEREPLPLIDLFHALHIARDFASNAEPQPLAQLWVGYMLSCLGGSLLTALALGQPISWLASDVTFSLYCAIFLLTLAPWSRSAFRRVANLPLVRHCLSAGDDLSWANSVANLGVARALTALHADSPIRQSACGAIVCGVLSGCGGGMLRSALGFNRREWRFGAPAHLSTNPWPLRFSAAMAALYYVLVNPHSTLPHAGVAPHEAKWALISLSLACNTAWTIVAELTAAAKALFTRGGQAAPVQSDSPASKKQKQASEKKKEKKQAAKQQQQAQAAQKAAQVQPTTEEEEDEEWEDEFPQPSPPSTSRSRPNAKKHAARK